MEPISLIIAIPDRALRRRLTQDMNGSPLVDVVAETHDLMTTYAEVEEREPAAVLIAGRLARQPEFEVMRALFATLDVRWLVITERADGQATDRNSPWDQGSDLFAVCSSVSTDRLIETLRALTRTARRKQSHTSLQTRSAAPPPVTAGTPRSDRFILIGASTGGVDALLTVLSSFPANCPPTFIVQHTGGGFGESLTRLLDRQCLARVRAARDGDTVNHGEIVLAAGNRAHMRLKGGSPLRIGVQPGAPISGHMPSVDALFQSAVPGARRAVAALLTGMGKDGAEGLKALKDAGATTIAQDEATSIVFGMPRAAMQLGAAQTCLPLQRIGPALLQACTISHAHSTGRVAVR